MTTGFYRRISAPFRSPTGQDILRFINFTVTGLACLAYLWLLVFLWAIRAAPPVRSILVPGISFVLVSVGRRLINAKRPYEYPDMDPILPRESPGRSFPSRHVFSCFVIAMTFLPVSSLIGGVLLGLGVLLGAARVIGGVHFLRDVTAGALLGILSGFLGYYLIP